MENISLSMLITIGSEVGVLLGAIIPMLVNMHKIKNGTKCQLRSEMLRIYYHNKDRERIRQYELENFILLYEAYTALKGNSFITKIHDEVLSWEVIS